MKLFRLFAAAAFVLPAFVLAGIEWETRLSWTVPEPNNMSFGAKDAEGNIYVRGMSGERVPTVWKLDPNGNQIYKKVINEGAFGFSGITLGRHNDAFLVGDDLTRIDRNSGEVIWSTDLNASSIYIDEVGDVYAYNPNQLMTWKWSYATGDLLWTAPVAMFPTDGPNFMAKSSSGVVFASKATGQVLSGVALTPAPAGRLSGFKTPTGGMLVVDQDRRGYLIRPGRTTLNLGILSPFQALHSVRVSPQGYFLLQTSVGLNCYSPDFHKLWSGISDQATDFEGEFALIRGSLYHVATGTRVQGQNGTGEVFSGDRLISFGFGNGQADITWRNKVTNAVVATFDSPDTVQESGGVSATAIGPGGDLLLVSKNRFLRISKDGLLRWSLKRSPDFTSPQFTSGPEPMRQPGAGITVTKDRRTAFLWSGSTVVRTIEVDLTRAAIVRTVPGQILVKGDRLYHMNFNSGGPTRTSMFDASTRDEIWRIPRTGLMDVGSDGAVYLKDKGNDPFTGELKWTLPNTVSGLVSAGDRVLSIGGGIIGWRNSRTGWPYWTAQPLVESDNRFTGNFDIRRSNGTVVLHPPSGVEAVQYNESTGAVVGRGSWGFWDQSSNFYRIVGGTIVKCADFNDQVGMPMDSLGHGAQVFVPDGNGSFYLIDTNNVGTPGYLTVTKWRPPVFRSNR